MQVDHIDDNTIRVRIGKTELEERGLQVLDLLGDKDKIQRFFYSILDEVDIDNSFTQDNPVTFQVMPNQGGIDLLISKVDGSKHDSLTDFLNSPTNNNPSNNQDKRRSFFDLEADDKLHINKRTQANLSPVDLEKKYPSNWKLKNEQLYQFNDIGIVAELAKALSPFEMDASLYFWQNKYYLDLEFLASDDLAMKPMDAWVIANEYGIKVPMSDLAAIKKAGKRLLVHSALTTLNQYFN